MQSLGHHHHMASTALYGSTIPFDTLALCFIIIIKIMIIINIAIIIIVVVIMIEMEKPLGSA